MTMPEGSTFTSSAIVIPENSSGHCECGYLINKAPSEIIDKNFGELISESAWTAQCLLMAELITKFVYPVYL